MGLALFMGSRAYDTGVEPNRHASSRGVACLSLALAGFISCQTTASGRKQLNFYSHSQEMRLGSQAWEEALEEATIAGVRVPKGAMVQLRFAAANRDPEVFDEPFRFDVARSDNPHFAFGGGGGILERMGQEQPEAKLLEAAVAAQIGRSDPGCKVDFKLFRRCDPFGRNPVRQVIALSAAQVATGTVINARHIPLLA